MRRRTFLAASTSILVGGCAVWKSPDPGGEALRRIQTKSVETSASVKRARLSVTFLPIEGDEAHTAGIAELWRSADVGPIDSATRRAWQTNGGRLAVLSSSAEILALRDRLPAVEDPHQLLLAAADVRDDSIGTRLTTPIVMGKTQDIAPGQPIPGGHTAMIKVDGKILAQTLSDCQYILSAGAMSPANKDPIQIRIEPQIQHGESRRQYVASEAAIRIDSRRDAWTLPGMEIDWNAANGQTLILSAIDDTPSTPWTEQLFAPAGRPMLIAIEMHAG